MVNLEELRDSLMTETFDVEKYASDVIQSGADIGVQLQNLTEADNQVDQLIQEQVSTHYEDLLSQATGIEKLEAHLSIMQTHMSSLVAAAERIKARIKEPFEKIRVQTITLSRMQQTCDLLRRVIRILQLAKKLQAQQQIPGGGEITKAAQSLSELSELWSPDLNGIEIIEQNERMILQARADVERNADAMLTNGMANQNQTQIGTALQVFYNLGVLESTILDRVVGQQLKEVKERFSELLDVKKISQSASESSSSIANAAGPGKAAMPGLGNMAAFRATMWNNIESLLEIIFSKVCEMIHLQRILCKKRDIVSLVTFIEMLPEDKWSIVANFWSKILEFLSNSLSKTSEQSNFVKQVLEGEYPKLLRLYNDLWNRLCQASMAYSLLPSDLPVPLKSPFGRSTEPLPSDLRDTLAKFEQAYLSRSLSRLFDPLNLMFSSNEGVPSKEEIEEIFRTIASELNIAVVDENLYSAVSKNVAKTVKLMCVKCEQSLVTDGEASQVIGYPTEAQKHNVEIVNLLFYFKAGVINILRNDRFHDNGCRIIFESLTDVDHQMKAAVAPLLSSIQDAIEAVILTIHNDNSITNTGNCSLYMKELQAFISRVSADFLQHFACKEFIVECVRPLAQKTVELFILHASLVRPLTKEGRMALASDCAQLELALDPLSIGIDYERVRAFRALLFILPQEIMDCPNLGKDSLPYSTVLHHLFSLSPPEIKSPHENAGWSISRYSNWLEDHPSERDRLQLIQGALESYVAATRQRQEKSYAFPYPIMLNILHKALSEIH